MSNLIIYLLVFLAVGIGFLLVNLFVGKLFRPHRPGGEKDITYECGETTIGSSWIQFDLRFYVVALLFVIFDVEMIFFFPWAVVFGTANHMADPHFTDEQRIVMSQQLFPQAPTEVPPDPQAAKSLAWVAFGEILIFFSVLLVGFAYLWKRGDLEWIRSTSSQAHPVPVPPTS